MVEISKHDWKLFRERVPDWQHGMIWMVSAMT